MVSGGSLLAHNPAIPHTVLTNKFYTPSSQQITLANLQERLALERDSKGRDGERKLDSKTQRNQDHKEGMGLHELLRASGICTWRAQRQS